MIHKETIWHITCTACSGYWTIPCMDEWKPRKLHCPHCGHLNEFDWDSSDEA